MQETHARHRGVGRAFLCGGRAGATIFPSHPITMLVGFPPGGPTDTLARLLAEGMEEKLGQTVVVETVSGASGTIATGRVVHAAPDGYTIGIGNWSAMSARRRSTSSITTS